MVKRQGFAVCGDCMDRIDLDALLAALRLGVKYTHECGRVLVKEQT